MPPNSCDLKINNLIEAMVLNYARGANKRQTELTGGMAPMAYLYLQTTHRNHVIILDDPLTSLERDSAARVGTRGEWNLC